MNNYFEKAKENFFDLHENIKEELSLKGISKNKIDKITEFYEEYMSEIREIRVPSDTYLTSDNIKSDCEATLKVYDYCDRLTNEKNKLLHNIV